MKNSWENIKNTLTNDPLITPGTVGYYAKVRTSINIFMNINESLIDREESLKAFNEDPDVSYTLVNDRFFESINQAIHMKL